MRGRLGFSFVASLCALAAPGAARGDVSIQDQQVVVSTKDARAVIQRSPLRISFQKPDGKEVLRHVEAGSPPVPRPPGVDPEPGGLQNIPDPEVYSPFAFELGGERQSQWYGGFWQGNMLVSARGGVVHSAQDVTAAERSGEGVRLTVSTTDPTRTLEVQVEPDTAGAIRVRAKLSDAAGVSAIGTAFEAGPEEAFRGFGGRHNALDQRGGSFYNWSEQENFGSGPFQPVADNGPGFGGDRYMAPNGPHAAYYPQSLFVSSRPYGFFLNGWPLSRWRMAADREDAWQVSIGSSELDYTVAVGNAPKAIDTLTEITGRQRVPPAWAVGPTLSRTVLILAEGADDAESYQRKVTEDIKKIQEHDLPVDSYVYESWAVLPEDFVKQTNEKLRKLGIHPQGYMRSFLSPDNIIEPPEPYNEALEKGYYVKTPAGTPYYYPSGVSTSQAMLVDYTNPEAVKWWKGRIRHMLDLGFDGFMNDFGEQVLSDMRFHNGEDGTTMHNRYTVLFQQVTREAIDEWQRDNPKRGEVFMYTRAGFSGRPGAAAYESSNFPGDETTDWNRATGLPSLATDMLNRSIGGAFGFNTDIGGYIDSYVDDLDKELYIRWSQWAALSPIFRVHNSCCSQGVVMPWTYDAETLKAWREAAELHRRARPLIRELWRQGRETGMPITRPLWLHYPNDPKAAEQDQQWLLGPDILVAPVVEDMARERKVYFPDGCWKHGETGARFTGPREQTVKAELGSLPWFVRCGKRPLAAPSPGPEALPRVRFKLSFKAGRHRGRRCAGPIIHGRVVGSGVRKVRRVVFYGDGKRVTRDSSRPFRKRIHRHKHRRVHVNRFEARVTFKDGRKRTMRIKQLGCRRPPKR